MLMILLVLILNENGAQYFLNEDSYNEMYNDDRLAYAYKGSTDYGFLTRLQRYTDSETETGIPVVTTSTTLQRFKTKKFARTKDRLSDAYRRPEYGFMERMRRYTEPESETETSTIKSPLPTMPDTVRVARVKVRSMEPRNPGLVEYDYGFLSRMRRYSEQIDTSTMPSRNTRITERPPTRSASDSPFLMRLRRFSARRPSLISDRAVLDNEEVVEAIRKMMGNRVVPFTSAVPTGSAAKIIIVEELYDTESTTEADYNLTEIEDIYETNSKEAELRTIRWSVKVRTGQPEPKATNNTTRPTRSKGIPLYDRQMPINLGAYLEDPFFDYGELKLARARTTGSLAPSRSPAPPTEDFSFADYFDKFMKEQETPVPTRSVARTRRSRTTPLRIDIVKLMDLVANLTMNYQEELTAMLNKSLEKFTIPTCPVPTTPTTEPAPETTTDLYANLTGTIMAKCFVCGLTDYMIPRDANCADAFAADLMPLVPMNPAARRHVASYRKYCRWMNMYFINETDAKAMWGRWTGGCAVRWVDVSGVYTQRTCRNRHRATMGRHYVSKRMAKLEMSLQNVDNGCIQSPAATLVPLSRGISLYAQFHVCVCTGSWCNSSVRTEQWKALVYLMVVLFYYIVMKEVDL